MNKKFLIFIFIFVLYIFNVINSNNGTGIHIKRASKDKLPSNILISNNYIQKSVFLGCLQSFPCERIRSKSHNIFRSFSAKCSLQIPKYCLGITCFLIHFFNHTSTAQLDIHQPFLLRTQSSFEASHRF